MFRITSLVAVIVLTLSACQDASEEAVTEPPIRPAKLVEVSAAQLERTVRLPAIVGAADTSILTFPVGGQLLELPVIEGAEVEQGEVLARLDERDFRSNLASAQATYENAQIEFQRAERLIAENAIAQSVVDQRRGQRDVALAALESARKALDDSQIRAPFSGVVADIHVESFETVSPTQPIMTLQSAGDAEVVVQVPASIVVDVERLEPIDLYLELDVAPGQRLPATLVSNASVANPTTQTYEARFAFSPPEDLLILPGMSGLLHGRYRVPAEGNDRGDMSVPLSAILSEGGASYVWLVDEATMTVSRRDVDVVPGVDENVVIRSGLEEGDVIVGAGGAYLSAGTRIRAYEN